MSSSFRGARRVLWLAATVVPLLASPVHAQYFGRNKVQYQKFDFQVLKTENFDIYFYPKERAAAAPGRANVGALARPVVPGTES